jgi:hypothetical protein
LQTCGKRVAKVDKRFPQAQWPEAQSNGAAIVPWTETIDAFRVCGIRVTPRRAASSFVERLSAVNSRADGLAGRDAEA